MSENYQSRELVIPGDVVYEGKIRTGENTYRIQEKVIATRLGLVNYDKDIVSVIALQGGFNPLVGDLVIGEVKDIDLGEWVVDIGSQIEASLSIPDAVDQPYRTEFDMTRILDVGDTIIAKIVDLDHRKTPILSILGSGLGKVNQGFIFRITSSKIPRLIGKKGSMINMIIKETGCRVVIGQNGLILIDGPTR
ncbi:S1 RNA-binding domain-containing protein, partial [Candidatus Bathyarchaeota archaeon]|nr:S1 RNA-binding domain-containing protein [Candidatus Bathyarchaeota archaeon]